MTPAESILAHALDAGLDRAAVRRLRRATGQRVEVATLTDADRCAVCRRPLAFGRLRRVTVHAHGEGLIHTACLERLANLYGLLGTQVGRFKSPNLESALEWICCGVPISVERDACPFCERKRRKNAQP